MYFRLENEESQKSQEIGNLIRVYNRSKEKRLKVSHLIFMSKMKRAISWQV